MFLEEGLEPSVDVYSKSVYLNRDAFWKSITAVLEKIDSEELKSLISGIEEFAMTSNSLFVFPLVFFALRFSIKYLGCGHVFISIWES